MAFFKFRKAGGDASGAAVQTESVEVLRRRARHRLIGAAVLVGVAVIGFPLLFDTQPRPVSVDIAIDIPDRDKARPLAAPAAASPPAAPAAATPAPPLAPTAGTVPVVAPKPAASSAVAAAPAAMAASEALGPREEILPRKTASAAAPASAARSAAGTVSGGVVAEAKPAATRPAEPRPAASKAAEPKPADSKPSAARTDDGAKALALLEGKQPEAAAERFVVQVGAFAEPDKAREVRLKLERAGLKTYTHVAETKEGKRIRVRVGPFEQKAEADKAAERIKALDLPAAILTL